MTSSFVVVITVCVLMKPLSCYFCCRQTKIDQRFFSGDNSSKVRTNVFFCLTTWHCWSWPREFYKKIRNIVWNVKFDCEPRGGKFTILNKYTGCIFGVNIIRNGSSPTNKNHVKTLWFQTKQPKSYLWKP